MKSRANPGPFAQWPCPSLTIVPQVPWNREPESLPNQGVLENFGDNMTKIHKPKVAGSSPAPATRKRHSLSAFFSLILPRLSCNPTAERNLLFHNHVTPLWKWKFAEIEPVPARNDGCTCGRNICESHPCNNPDPWRSTQYKDQSYSGFFCIPGCLFPSNRIQIAYKALIY